MKQMNSLKEIIKKIKRSKSIALFTHINPDFDAFGSAFSIYYSLKALGKKVELFSSFKLTFHQNMLFEDIINNNMCNEKDFDLFLCVDTSSLDRLGEYSYIFENKNNESITIDHHFGNTNFSKYNYINHERSSCCEIIFELLSLMKCKITSKIATLLYAGLSSDTSSFQNSGTKLNSHLIAAELIQLGADISKVNEALYETRTKKEIDFKKYLWNNFKKYKDCAYILIDKKLLTELKGSKSDCDSFSRSLVSIEGINRSFSLIEQTEGVYNLSMRSKSGYDIRVVAQKLGGGGHICAAGAQFKAKNINSAKKRVLDALFKVEENEN